MIGSLAWRALMRRNMIYRKRNPIGTLFEFFLPIAFVGVMVAIKNAVQRSGSLSSDIVAEVVPDEFYVVSPVTFADYIAAMQTERTCIRPSYSRPDSNDFWISGMPRGSGWPVPFVKCDSDLCRKVGEDAQQYCSYGIIAVSGLDDTDSGGSFRAQQFQSWIYEEYPETVSGLPFDYDLVQVFPSSKAMSDYVKQGDYGTLSRPSIVMGIVFEGNDANNFRYTLRQNSTNFNMPENADRPATRTTPATDQWLDSFAKDDYSACFTEGGTAYQGYLGESCTGQYLYNGVITMQRLVNDFIFNVTLATDAGYRVSEGGVRFVPFPSPAYEDDGFYANVAGFLPLLLVLGLLYPVSCMISPIVREKQLRQKELMKMMSVTDADIGTSWFLSFFGFHFITATLCAMVSTQLYDESEIFYLWVFWVLSFLVIVVYCMTIAALTTKPTRAVLIGLLVFFSGVFLTNVSGIEDSSAGTLSLVSLHPVAAFAYGLQEIGYLEDQGVGLKGSTIGSTDKPSGYTFSTAIGSLIFDCLLWGFACYYLNRVIQPEYGQAKPLWFPCKAIMNCFKGKRGSGAGDDDNLSPIDPSVPNEPVSETLKKQGAEGKNIEIMGLRKQFGDKAAVDGLSLSMYSGQVTALLGHNGAGKTTTISMLTGALAPTEGYAKIAGRDIRYDMDNIRGEIGICLQHDCLFPLLTVKEHLQFFSRIKGLYKQMPKHEAEKHIEQVIQDVALLEKRNTFSKNLSGGMKRKLSVAIAFCGNSKVVLLDEPTSGMDPFSRRFTWNVIRQYRQGRVIILTTHFMDEADILGDRIAIMSEGRLRCCGSPLFLKKTYGVGYQLTIEKTQDSNKVKALTNGNKEIVNASNNGGGKSHDDVLAKIVKSSVPEATLLSNVGSEMSYQLPIGASAGFVSMFENLDKEIEKKNIATYGVGITTLDEVFMLVARGEHTETQREHFASSRHMTPTDESPDSSDKSARSRMNLEKNNLFVPHVGALFRKRAANFRRDKKAWCCTTIMPSIFVCIGLILFKFAAPSRNLDQLELTIGRFNEKIDVQPRNPVLFNQAGNSFQCQPGNCIYQSFEFGNAAESDLIPTFCGQGGYVDGNCSIDESNDIMDGLDGVIDPLGRNIESVYNSSIALLDSNDEFAATKYGTILFNHEPSSVTADGTTFTQAAQESCVNNAQSVRGESYCDRLGGYGYTIQYNFTALHAAPIFMSVADQALIREALGSNEVNIQTNIHPLPITNREEGYGKAEDAFLAWFLLVLSFPFITGAFATFIVEERQSKAKHLQTVAGVKPSSYWISSFLWDMMNYQFPMWITIFLFLIFGVDILTTRDRNVIGAVICIILFYGPASAGFAYCISFAFTSASLCNVVIIIFGFIIGMGGPLTCFILTLLGNDPGSPRNNLITAASIISWVLRFTPSFCLGKGLFYVINIEALDFLEGKKLDAFSEPVMLIEFIFLIIQTFLWLGLAILLDRWSSNPRMMQLWEVFTRLITCKCFCGLSGSNATDITMALPDDSDVIAEQNRVLQGEANEDLIVISQLTKRYGSGKVAVNNMCLAIPPGQCFGLLGINGAGKTTTMQMLTAEFPPTDGDATLAGYSVRNEPEKTRRRIGYCPQFDAHFANMTGREHVELYASIKGVPKDFVKEAAAAKLHEVGLNDADSDRLSSGYSGGMKRRLSLACAMIGQPQIVFLDECSTGVDPVARREIWELVSSMVSGKNVPPEERTSVILTTHSMEECEALCPRIGIMANGRLRCLGSAQHLKNKFGKGYQIELKTKIVDRLDDDYLRVRMELARAVGVTADEENTEVLDSARITSLKDLHTALTKINPEGYLVTLISDSHPIGYNIYKNVSNGVATLEEVALFATNELRVRNVELFVENAFPHSVLRERQDTKSRYEVSSEGLKISSLFAMIEERKETLKLSDYGISQTSLEQVFNMHAAEAEKLKHGRDDH